jgi:hypothetical protein
MLFNLGQTLRSLTTSPISAQRRLEAGGAAALVRDRVEHDSDARDFLLPSDVDPFEVALAVRGFGTRARDRRLLDAGNGAGRERGCAIQGGAVPR